MKKSLYPLLFLVIFSLQSMAQAFDPNPVTTRTYDKTTGPKLRSINSLTIDTLSNTQEIVNTLFGPGISVTNLNYIGDTFAVGRFSDITGGFQIDSGLVMTTGRISDVAGPNSSASTTTVNYSPGDSSLAALSGNFYPTYDAAVIEFDFTPLTDTLMLSFVFGSEEYPEWIGSNFNDVFAFFVTEQGSAVPYNMAMIPGTMDPITINTVNTTNNPAYYIDNTSGQVLEADGLTTLITQMYMPVPNQNYHFKIGITDVSDQAFDSYVFIKAKGLLGYAKMPAASFAASMSGNTVNFTSTGGWARDFFWDFGDGTTDTAENPIHTYLQSGQYTVTFSAINYYQVNTVTYTLNVGGAGITENEQAVALDLLGSDDGIFRFRTNPLVSGTSSLQVFTTAGSLAFSQALVSGQKEVTLDLRSLPHGVYSVCLQSNGQKISRKLVR